MAEVEMGADQQSQEVKECQVVVNFVSKTPVVGCQMIPTIRLRLAGSLSQPQQHSIRYSWYREQVKCSVHHSELASLQCTSCVQLKIPIKDSFHCSRECFVAAWPEHLARHHIAAASINKTTSSDQQEPNVLRSCGSWSNLANAVVVEGEWIKLGSSETYEPSVDDTGFRLKLETFAINPSTGIPMSPVEIVETNPVIDFPPPLPRCMIQVEKFKKLSSSDITFSVLSYNILADMYASIDSEKQRYCPTWALAWEYRRKNLLREIISYDADIICLQEVQSNHFENFFEPELTKRGYSVMYKKKEKSVFAGGMYIFEGCATFYRRHLFKEVASYELEFANTALPVVEALEPGCKSAALFRLTKDNVALVVVLEAVRGAFQTRICVANTHIHANPKLPDVKLCQVVDLVHGIEKAGQSQVPLLICGDLNSFPESDPHKFLVRGGLDSFQSTVETDPLGICKHLKLRHSLVLVSAYASLCSTEGSEAQQLKKMDLNTFEPLFTNYTPTFSGTIDYILYSADRLRVVSVLELLDRECESVRNGLPSAQWSSDHIALMARFRVVSPRPTITIRKPTAPPFPPQPLGRAGRANLK